MKRLFTVTVNGQKYDVAVAEKDAPGAAATAAPKTQPMAAPAPAPAKAPAAPVSKAPAESPKTEVKSGGAAKSAVAPMPGKIITLLVKEGDEVQRGQALLVLEAMKLENDIVAPQAGKVEKILVQEGQSVDAGAELVKIS